MIKESIQKEDITIVNIYAPNIGTPEAPGRYILQTNFMALDWTRSCRQEEWSGLPFPSQNLTS